MSKKNSLIICMVAALSLFVEMGCATKKYVKQQVDPVSGRVDELTEVSKRNENAIKDVDSRAQSGIQSVQAKATEVDAGFDVEPRSRIVRPELLRLVNRGTKKKRRRRLRSRRLT